ncbi:MAG: prevent-host-death protein [Cyanothece sp. SIO2G6]|nr:prevent-host-death protein [Cyanothece sp. SIO2G6]
MTTPISYREAHSSLDQLCDQVIETGEAVIISRPDGKNVALVSEAELSSLLETLYLLRSPTNATRLKTALARSQAGAIKPQSIEELYQKFGFVDDGIVEMG